MITNPIPNFLKYKIGNRFASPKRDNLVKSKKKYRIHASMGGICEVKCLYRVTGYKKKLSEFPSNREFAFPLSSEYPAGKVVYRYRPSIILHSSLSGNIFQLSKIKRRIGCSLFGRTMRFLYSGHIAGEFCLFA